MYVHFLFCMYLCAFSVLFSSPREEIKTKQNKNKLVVFDRLSFTASVLLLLILNCDLFSFSSKYLPISIFTATASSNRHAPKQHHHIHDDNFLNSSS